MELVETKFGARAGSAKSGLSGGGELSRRRLRSGKTGVEAREIPHTSTWLRETPTGVTVRVAAQLTGLSPGGVCDLEPKTGGGKRKRGRCGSRGVVVVRLLIIRPWEVVLIEASPWGGDRGLGWQHDPRPSIYPGARVMTARVKRWTHDQTAGPGGGWKKAGIVT
jgi:hypothetical protein